MAARSPALGGTAVKILFPGPDEVLVCTECWSPVGGPGYWDNGDAEDYWCDKCCDFCGVEARPSY